MGFLNFADIADSAPQTCLTLPWESTCSGHGVGVSVEVDKSGSTVL